MPSEDALAVLLVCMHTDGSRNRASAQPLTAGEYGKLATELHRTGNTPATLFESDHDQQLMFAAAAGVEPDRLGALLQRRSGIGLALERYEHHGISVITRADSHYPQRLRKRLRFACPPLLYVAGAPDLLAAGGIAVVGSRGLDAAGEQFAVCAGSALAGQGRIVISGAARGADRLAMESALAAGGVVVGVLAARLARESTNRSWRDHIRSGMCTLISPFSPSAGFHAGNAMARNKLVYALSDATIVVSSARGSGGTWAGALENQKNRWVPLFVRAGDDIPYGNSALLREHGALPITGDELRTFNPIRDYADEPPQPPANEPVSPTSESQRLLF